MRILILLFTLSLTICSCEVKPDLSDIEYSKKYHDNGKVSSIGKYFDDKMEGEWKLYYESGQLKATAILMHNTVLCTIIAS